MGSILKGNTFSKGRVDLIEDGGKHKNCIVAFPERVSIHIKGLSASYLPIQQMKVQHTCTFNSRFSGKRNRVPFH